MIKESDIRSDKTLKEYQKLVDQDSRKLLPFSASAMPMMPRAKQSLEIRSGFRKPALFPKPSAGD